MHVDLESMIRALAAFDTPGEQAELCRRIYGSKLIVSMKAELETDLQNYELKNFWLKDAPILEPEPLPQLMFPDPVQFRVEVPKPLANKQIRPVEASLKSLPSPQRIKRGSGTVGQEMAPANGKRDKQSSEIISLIEENIVNLNKEEINSNDISGLDQAKTVITEILIYPRKFPNLFKSRLTLPPRGVLLFGPPGTGKTLLAKWIASECGSTFFNIRASTIFSKFIGESEKIVRTLFEVADRRSPSVVFIDEIDSVLGARSDSDHESTKRIKNEFLTALDGALTDQASQILFVGATNIPWSLDAAVLRRFPRKLFIPLPGVEARERLLRTELEKHEGRQLEPDLVNFHQIAELTHGYSGSDLFQALKDAAMRPVREFIAAGGTGRMRSVSTEDILKSIEIIKKTESENSLDKYSKWNLDHAMG